jgi:hypothetical protein
MLVESGMELNAVITIVAVCALVISLFGGYFDRPNKQRLASIAKAVGRAGTNKGNQ